MATEPPEPPTAPAPPPADVPVEDTDTSAAPPATAAADQGPKASPVDDMVASLMDEKPTRPHLSVVPPPAEAVKAGAAAKAAPLAPVEEDPLAVVLDQQRPRRDEPEAVGDAWSTTTNKPAAVDVGKLLDFGGLTGGLRQLAGWLEKQVPSINAAVNKFLSSVEVTLTKAIPATSPDGNKAEKVDTADRAAKPVVSLVPEPAPVEGADALAKIDRAVSAGDAMEAAILARMSGPRGVVASAPEPGAPPAPVEEPGNPTGPLTDPQPEHPPIPIQDPEPEPDPDPNRPRDPAPMGDPPAPAEPPVRDPAPMGDPPPPPDPNPGRDPLPMGDPVPGPGTGIIATATDGDLDPIATD